MTATTPKLICFPPAALNGGPLDTAPPKVGQWAWQPKIDDRRVVIHVPSRTIWNQYGQLSVAQDSQKFEGALDALQRESDNSSSLEWLDCGLMEYLNDMMRGCIVIFDMIIPEIPFDLRRGMLQTAVFHSAQMGVLPPDMDTMLLNCGRVIRDEVFLINQWPNGANKIDSYNALKAQNERIGRKFFEGVVAKKMDSPYLFGQVPKQVTCNWVKHRFDQIGGA